LKGQLRIAGATGCTFPHCDREHIRVGATVSGDKRAQIKAAFATMPPGGSGEGRNHGGYSAHPATLV
jgi:hypothetical protein